MKVISKFVAIFIAFFLSFYIVMGSYVKPVYAIDGALPGFSAVLVPLVKAVLVSAGVLTAEEAANSTESYLLKLAMELPEEQLATIVDNAAVITELAKLVNAGEIDDFKDFVDSNINNVGDTLIAGSSAMFLSFRKADDSKYQLISTNGYIVYDAESRKATFYGTEIYSYFYPSDSTIYRSSGWSTNMDGYMDSYVYWNWYGDVRGPDDDTIDEVVKPGIGVVTINGIEYPINDDGTVTIDGVDYPINDDGSITINGDTYYPTYNLNMYDNSALLNLLNSVLSLLKLLNFGNVAEDDSDLDLGENALPGALAQSELAKFQMPSGITTVFPFCIPFDVYRGIQLLSAKPVAPKFEVPFEIPEIGVFPGYSTTIVIDFEEYDKYFKVVRWGTFFIAVMGICFLSFKIVKGNT